MKTHDELYMLAAEAYLRVHKETRDFPEAMHAVVTAITGLDRDDTVRHYPQPGDRWLQRETAWVYTILHRARDSVGTEVVVYAAPHDSSVRATGLDAFMRDFEWVMEAK